MTRLFEKIGRLIENHPFKVLLTALFLVVVMLIGARNIYMATGNDTLVDAETEVYKQHEEMEDTFGGDSILVVFEASTEEELLSVENLTKMWNVEKRMAYDEDIYSIMSPATLLHQMTIRQSDVMEENVLELSGGLSEMGSKLSEIGHTLLLKEVPDPKEMEEKLEDFTQATSNFDKLIDGQNNIATGIGGLSDGTWNAAEGVSTISAKLKELGNSAAGNPQMSMQLTALAENLDKSASGLKEMSARAKQLEGGPRETATALDGIKDRLGSETEAMKDSLKGGISPEELKTMAEGFITMGGSLTEISGALAMFHEKSDMMEATLPKSQEEADLLLYEEGNLRTVFSDVVKEGTTGMMIVKLDGGVSDARKVEIIEELNQGLSGENFDTVTYMVSGKPVLDTSLQSEMKVNMMIMVGSALVIMLLVLALVFKVQWRMLSLAVILVSVIATLGFMGHIGVPVTMVSMAVFPILIGLGIDYSIQFHNRYEEEGSVVSTVKHVGKAVFIAVLATILGFLSLYISPVPMIQDFGKMLTLGVFISFLGSLFILLPILHIRNTIGKPSSVQQKSAGAEAGSRVKSVLGAMTGFILKLKYPILILFLLLSVAGFSRDSSIGIETDMESFMPQEMPALVDLHTVRDVMGSTDQVILYLTGTDLDKAASLESIKETGDYLEAKYPDVITDVKSLAGSAMLFSGDETLSFKDYAETVSDLPVSMSSMFITEDATKSALILNIRHLPTSELEEFVTSLKETMNESDLNAAVTGKSILDIEMVKGLTSGRLAMTGLGLILVFAALLLIYRNPVKALIPILPVVSIIGLSSGIMYLAGISYTPITATLGALVLGMGTEMTIMLMERYTEERRKGEGREASMKNAVGSIGVAILASGLTTVGGFSVLMLSDFVILRDFGLMTVVNISLALLSTFVLLPPILYLMDRFLLSGKEKKAAAILSDKEEMTA